MGRTTRLLVVLAATTAVVFVLVRRRRTVDLDERTGDVVPHASERRDALVDDASDDSFPASDPPSYWGRGTES